MVSIIIPVYNVRDYIERCIKSVIAQTFRGDLECIIIDDCGNDDSILIAQKCVYKENNRIKFRFISHKNNRGLAAARNTGIEHATGEFVMHLDSDDWLEPRAIEILVKKQLETNADIISGNALAHFEDHTKLLEEPDYKGKKDMIYNTIELSLDHVIWRRLIRKSLYNDNNIRAVEGVNIGEDHHTLPRLVYFANKITKVDELVYHYNCVNQNSYMQSSKRAFNYNRYISDISSIRILKDFFIDKNQDIIKRLDEIEHNYSERSMRKALYYNDKKSYYSICNQLSVKPSYNISRLKLFKDRICSFLSRCLQRNKFGNNEGQ